MAEGIKNRVSCMATWLLRCAFVCIANQRCARTGKPHRAKLSKCRRSPMNNPRNFIQSMCVDEAFARR